MTTKVKNKQSLGVQYALQIIEEGKEPMSLDEIKGKYQLEFPFKVKKVVHVADHGTVLPIGIIVIVKEYGKNCDGDNAYRIEIDSEDKATPANFKQWVLV